VKWPGSAPALPLDVRVRAPVSRESPHGTLGSMTDTRTLLVTRLVADRLADFLATLEAVEVLVAPEGQGETLSPEELGRVQAAFFTNDSGGRRVLGAARRAPNLRWMHLGHAGTDAPIFQEMMDRGIVVTNSSGVTAEPIAQSVMAGLLALNRGLPAWMDAQRRRAWEPLEDGARDLRGQTVTILGLGAIGGHVARFSRAFGLRVVGVRRSPAGIEDGVDEWLAPDRLAEVLPRTDVLVITLPLTSQTRGLLDAALLDRMPEGALLINVARGQIVDEAALAERLASGHLGGAYLDVFEEEPLPEDSLLWSLPNVIISPHNAGHSAGNRERVDAVFREEVTRWLRNEESPRRVRDR